MNTNNNAFAAEAPDGSFKNSACVACHEKSNKQLVADWRASAHSKGKKAADCIACHGDTHKGAAIKARRNQTCIACHGGKKSPVVHSYTTSKHGVIYGLEKREWDWTLPLEQANYRAPGCAYCHMHKGNHNVTASIRQDSMDAGKREAAKNNPGAACHDCHSPRYVTSLFNNGEDMLNIGRMKLREATAFLEQAATKHGSDELAPAKTRLKKMQSHLKNVSLGIGHQSPDYQWWHGQPALDGDLLRIKGLIGELRRRQAITGARQGQ